MFRSKNIKFSQIMSAYVLLTGKLMAVNHGESHLYGDLMAINHVLRP